MEVLNPEVYWIDGRCYRKNPSRNQHFLPQRPPLPSSNSGTNLAPYRELDDFDECDPDAPDPNIFDDPDEPFDIESYEIEPHPAGGFRTKCSEIPNSLYSGIIGSKGSVKKRIELETKTKISIPRIGEKGDILIRGQSKTDVATARRRIELISKDSRFKREPTHFLCFPLNSPSIVKNVKEFKEKVLATFKNETSSFGIDEKVFQEPEKIHLTICVLVLLEPRERRVATEVLESMIPEIKNLILNSQGQGSGLRLRLQGLEIMNDDPSQVDVLYAKCGTPANPVVQAIANLINMRFLETGFAKKNRGLQPSEVKLHATLMNTRFRSENEPCGNNDYDNDRKRPNRKSFNAKPILEKFGDYDFGFVELKEVHISTRHTKGKDGFYKLFSKISL